jgi:dihydroflavonol-4-reductase
MELHRPATTPTAKGNLVSTGAEYGAVYTCACDLRPGEGAGHGLEPRPVAETVGDALRWLYEQGHLSERQVGNAGARSPRVLEGRP